jgi:phosphatidylglycerophosphatase A
LTGGAWRFGVMLDDIIAAFCLLALQALLAGLLPV